MRDDDDDDHLDLIDTVAELRRAHGVSVSYAALYKSCIDSLIPATRARGRWHVARADLPRIASAFGVKGGSARARAREPAAAAA